MIGFPPGSMTKDLNKLLLKPAIKELNQKSNLIVFVNTVKNSRNVIALHFNFKEDSQIKKVI
ncbi:replication initiation protein [Photorhabdus sp. RM126S]